MSILDLKNNLDNLNKKSKDDLIRNIHELLIHEKRLDNKIIGMKTENRYLNRHLTKIRDLINKILRTKLKDDNLWSKEKK